MDDWQYREAARAKRDARLARKAKDKRKGDKE